MRRSNPCNGPQVKLSSAFNKAAPYIATALGGAMAGCISAMGIDYVFAQGHAPAALRPMMLIVMPMIAGISTLGSLPDMDGYERAVMVGALTGFGAKAAQLTL